MPDFGKETIVFFEIDLPFCSLSYGVSPCPAVLGADSTRKCYNTLPTCPVPGSYDGDSRTSGKYVTLRFTRGQNGVNQYGPVIPSMSADPRTTPAIINLAAMDENMGALGQRESVVVTLDDHRHSDNLVDKYRLQRQTGAASSVGETYDPNTQGTFWGKFLARNTYLVGTPCRIRQGFFGDALEDMRVRNYVINKVDGPTDGQVQITIKDVFSLIEARKAVAPAASSGTLQADIAAAAGSATLSPVGVGNDEYPASGYVCIAGSEIASFTRAGDVLTLTARGALGTTAADHKAEDSMQVVLQYSAQLAKDIIYDLLVNYTAVPASDIPLATWNSDLAAVTELYTRVIAQPTPVLDLIGSLCEVAGLTPIPDVQTGEIGLAALRASAATATVTDDAWIIDGSFSLRRQDVKRVSEIWVFYGQVDPTGDISDEANYHSRLLDVDLAAEGPQQYGVPAIRKVFGAWIPQFGRAIAQAAADRIMAIFRDAPDEAEFAVDASREGRLILGRPFVLEAVEVQDETGATASVQHVPLSLELGENKISVRSQKVIFSGAEGGGTARNIFIENDALNLNLRTLHDLLYAAPTGAETVTFFVQPGVTIGSASTGNAAITTGSWPGGQPLFLTNEGRIQGRGGLGGQGANSGGWAGGPAQPGNPGNTGGPALEALVAITVDNSAGQIYGGGGGGGGGASMFTVFSEGAGGGGGAGTVGGSGGPRGTNVPNPATDGATSGGDGSRDAGGTGGTGNPGDGFGGASGRGGDGGLPGAAGNPGSNSFSGPAAAGGPGGNPGNYIVGNVLVTWTATGDRRGNVA